MYIYIYIYIYVFYESRPGSWPVVVCDRSENRGSGGLWVKSIYGKSLWVRSIWLNRLWVKRIKSLGEKSLGENRGRWDAGFRSPLLRFPSQPVAAKHQAVAQAACKQRSISKIASSVAFV